MNTFDASVTLHLVDRVSGALGTIARQLTRNATACQTLQRRLTAIGSTYRNGVTMALGGAALAAPLISATQAAEKYQHQLNQMNSAGLSQREIAQSVGAAWNTTGKIITSNVTENLKTISDLRTVLGSTKEAISFMPQFSKVEGAMGAILDGKFAGHASEMTYAMAKAIDMQGKVGSKKEMFEKMEKMFKADEASLGRVTPSDYQQFFKYARQGKYGLGDNFLYKLLPELLLENKTSGGGGASGVGVQIAAVYSSLVQGQMSKRMAESLASMGLVKNGAILKTTTTGTMLEGGVTGKELLTKDPFEWVKKVYLPKLAEKFHLNMNETDKLVQASNSVLKGNRLATSLIGELIKKQTQYERFGKMYDKTDSVDKAYNRAMGNDLTTNYKAFGAAMENLNTAVGIHVLPVLIPMINKLSSGIQHLALAARANPGLTKLVVGIAAFSSAALVAGGVVTMVSAGFAGIVTVCGAIAAVLSPEILVPLAVGVAAVVAVAAKWKDITNWIKSHGDILNHVMAETVRLIQKIGLEFQKFGNVITTLMDQLGIALGNAGSFYSKLTGINAGSIFGSIGTVFQPVFDGFTEGMASVGKNLRDMTKVSEAQKTRNSMTLARAGIHAIASTALAAHPVAASAGKPNITISPTTHITINAPPGTDAKELGRIIDKKVDEGHQRLIREALRSSNGSSGKSVARSNNQLGATRK